jgi:hypothetical protein
MGTQYSTRPPVNARDNSLRRRERSRLLCSLCFRNNSTKEFVKLVVCAYPNPYNCVAVSLADGAVLLVDADGPDVVVAAEFLESKRRMAGVIGESRISASRSQTMESTQPFISPPKTRPRARDHRRFGSSGSSPSAAESRKKASRRGLACGKARRLSHASSSRRAKRKRAKSASSDCLSDGKASQTLMISSVVLLILV